MSGRWTKASVSSRRPDALGDDAAGHAELDAEFGRQTGVGLVVAQHGGEIIADLDGDFLDVVRRDRAAGDQVQHAVDGAVGAVAGGIFLDAQALRQDRPFGAGLALAGAVLGAGGGDRVQEPLRMLQRVGVGGEAGLGQARGHDAGVRGLAGVERLRHGAEIRHQAGATATPPGRWRWRISPRPACVVWRRRRRHRRRRTARWDASLSGAAGRCRGGTVQPRSHSRRHRR